SIRWEPSRTLRLRASGVYTDQESDVTAPQGEDRIVSSDKNAASMEKGRDQIGDGEVCRAPLDVSPVTSGHSKKQAVGSEKKHD
ncbi:hypothetical protein KXV98_006622, partial [Aspergillus fumigatus]